MSINDKLILESSKDKYLDVALSENKELSVLLNEDYYRKSRSNLCRYCILRFICRSK
jgi:hypothetical protein